MATAKPRGG